MKIIIAPDKFKGSLTSIQACEAIRQGLLVADATADLQVYPMADGGDGFATVMKHYLHTQTIPCKAADPLNRPIEAAYEMEPFSHTAVIEMAAASGLTLLSEADKNPLKTSTYGTGLLVKDAIERGAEKLILGIGRSATNDGGAGMLEALGFRFYDLYHNIVSASGENLSRIKYIVPPAILPSLQFVLACDVKNKLLGKQGAAWVYAAQKGAAVKEIPLLDKGLEDFAALLHATTGKDVANIPGTGAGGGVAAGLAAFFKLEIMSGAAMLIHTSSIEAGLAGADLVITGEGKIDRQTLNGKIVQHIAALGKRFNIPVIAFCGEAAVSENISQLNLEKIVSLTGGHTSGEEAMANAGSHLSAAAARFLSNFHAGA